MGVVLKQINFFIGYAYAGKTAVATSITDQMIKEGKKATYVDVSDIVKSVNNSTVKDKMKIYEFSMKPHAEHIISEIEKILDSDIYDIVNVIGLREKYVVEYFISDNDLEVNVIHVMVDQQQRFENFASTELFLNRRMDKSYEDIISERDDKDGKIGLHDLVEYAHSLNVVHKSLTKSKPINIQPDRQEIIILSK